MLLLRRAVKSNYDRHTNYADKHVSTTPVLKRQLLGRAVGFNCDKHTGKQDDLTKHRAGPTSL
jgi:hypothetical protein